MTLAAAFSLAEHLQPIRVSGRVHALRGLTLQVDDLPLPVGALVRVEPGMVGAVPVLGEVVGFTREQSVVMILGQTAGIRPGDRVTGLEAWQSVPVGDSMLGRCLDGLGRPIDGKGAVGDLVRRPLSPDPIPPTSRARITAPLHTGVRALDLFTTLGRGQRLGLFAGPGVGKSTLLGLIARGTSAEVNVIALIGERGREVNDFIHHSLGDRGLARSVLVVSTSDESPVMRLRAARLAHSVAEHFRDRGRSVLLMMDSITRFAHAQRQVGLSVGEPPATKGYTPSVFSQLALLLERAGSLRSSGGVTGGSITGLYTILVEGDDMTEPVADAARGILDGHVVLSRRLAQRAHYPAIDVLDSVSRVADAVCDPAHVDARRRLLRLLASYAEIEDLVQIGAYARGAKPESDVAIDMHGAITALLRQGEGEHEEFEKGRERLVALAGQAAQALQRSGKGRVAG
ncbi:MAG: FliI/YscN family ATPase [Phycisphaerae bacterium]|nr:FliI/YscN family ATPase [Phycisphaerae bacterium]